MDGVLLAVKPANLTLEEHGACDDPSLKNVRSIDRTSLKVKKSGESYARNTGPAV